MDYVLGDREGKWNQLQREMHMAAPMHGQRKKIRLGFLFV